MYGPKHPFLIPKQIPQNEQHIRRALGHPAHVIRVPRLAERDVKAQAVAFGDQQIVRGNVPTLRKAAGLLDAYEQMWIERTTRIADVLVGEEGSTT